MKRNRNVEESSEGAPEWMTTYSDLVTLLLTFFILLFSMAVLDKQKFEEVAMSLRSSFNNTSNGEMFESNKGKEIFSILEQNNVVNSENSTTNDSKNKSEDEKNEESIEKMKNELGLAVIDLNLGEHVKVIETKEQIILRVDSAVLFDFGSADIKDSAKPVLTKLGTILKQTGNDILIQGHTDNIPIDTYLFPSNWELSTKRATNVVLFLVQSAGMKPERLTPTGNGEFKPIAPNDTDENRRKNRRIDIVIEKTH